MNAGGWIIFFVGVFLALIGLISGIMTIHAYLEAHRHPKIKQPPKTVSIIVIVSILVLSGILTPISFALGRPSTPQTSSHVNNQTPTPTITPTPSFLYQADFTQGSQEWLDSSHSQQWTYNVTDKLLEADGSVKCCDTMGSLRSIVLNAPYTPRGDYAVEARIKSTGLNSNNPYAAKQPPFFGIFLRGLGLNTQGYMAGIIAFTPNEPNSSSLSYLVVMGPTVPGMLINNLGENYNLDNQWHTYRIEARGNTFTFFIDHTQLYKQTVENYFAAGPQVGIEDYDYILQIQNFTAYPL